MDTITAKMDKVEEEVTLSIINDAVIFYRLCDGISRLMNTGDSVESEMEKQYMGINSAFSMLGLNGDFAQRGVLTDIFLNYSERADRPGIAAESILENWMGVLGRPY